MISSTRRGARRRLAVSAGIVVAALVTGCSRDQLDTWVRWHGDDPTAAEDFARLPVIDALIHANEPAPDRAGASSDAPQFEEYLTNRHGATWDRIAYCESGGRWDYPPVTNRTGTYSGGLMIWTKAWLAYGGQQFAGQAWQATKAEQITVAERILADRGWQAWDCA
jgi:Transglycosylase-like domain